MGPSYPNSSWEKVGLLEDPWKLLDGVIPSRYGEGMGRIPLKELLSALADRQLLVSPGAFLYFCLICFVLTHSPLLFLFVVSFVAYDLHYMHDHKLSCFSCGALF